MESPRHAGGPAGGISAEDAEALLLAMEGVEPGRSYGYPAYLLAGRFFARFRDEDTVLVLQLGSIEERDVLMRLDPDAFFFTDHYRDSAAVLIRLRAVAPALLADVLRDAWQDVGSRRAGDHGRTRRRKRR